MISDNNGMYMPVAPLNSGYGGGGFGGGWSNDIWLIIIILFAFGGFGGWGGNGGGNSGGVLYPWMNQADITTTGFQNAATNQAISSLQNSVTSGFGDIQTALCGGFAGVNANLANGFAQSEIAENARQMANMNQIFGLSQQMAQCCCDNRLATANLGSDIAREACATRTADTQNTQSILNVINNGIQSIKDQLCSDKIDAKNEKIADLERQLTMANLAASQGAQTAAILANNEAQTATLEQYLAPIPRPAFLVQNPNCCSQNYGCGCGSF